MKKPLDYDKLVKLETAIDIIAKLDEGLGTLYLKKAEKRLKLMAYARKNIPF